MSIAWLEQIFGAKGLAEGKPVRRKIASVMKFASEAALTRECQRRGLILIRTPNQYVIYPTVTFTVLTGPN